MYRRIKRSLAYRLERQINNLRRFPFWLKMKATKVERIHLGPGAPLKIACPNLATLKRARSLLSKEPQTIRWLDGLEENDVLWDIGSNIGTFSLYAAHTRKAEVLSFDPLFSNFAALMRNIEINNLSQNISAFCIALTDVTRVDSLFLRPEHKGMVNNDLLSDAGESGNVFGCSVNQLGNNFQPAGRQAVIGISVDDFISLFGASPPSYIKLDVDGNEMDILKGASKTLASPELKSVLVEIEESFEDRAEELREILSHSGFIETSKENTIQNSETGTAFNYIFTRSAH